MYKILTLNQISIKGLERFSRENYELASEIGHPDAIMVRSQKIKEDDLGDSIQAIARAGAGVNNVPVLACTAKGIPVFNAPGANANAVKELVATALILSSRGIVQGIQYVNTLGHIDDSKEMHQLLEKEKKQFKGSEVAGKTLGVIGLGAIGSKVATMALQLGMDVVGYDPALSVDAAWRLPSEVKKMENLQSLLGRSDYITLHLPAIDATRNLINHEVISSFKKGAHLLNFARSEIVDTNAILEGLDSGQLGGYAADFPEPVLIGRNDVLLMPHIGASTAEAEENCAIMVANQLIDFLENGNITNSVNFPQISLERTEGYRIALANSNKPKMLNQILSILAEDNINVIDMLNKSRNDVAYTLLDVDVKPERGLIAKLENIDGVINVRSI
ncbi:MAG: phosphoglycerate dehydrogenase [Pseudomonadales bacterium]|nr:phosphoglycerate dehydrogenase [Pseudomonadales bacterium]